MAKACPVLLLTDLDQWACAPDLLRDWFAHPKHPDFLLRIAVREVEAWVLAADHAFEKFLGLRRPCRIDFPERLRDPKIELLKLAMQSPRRDIRDALVRSESSGNLKQGPAYNSTLASFVVSHWSPVVAASKCSSLERMLRALSALESDWNKRGP
jgi:hypothetical protein